MGACSWSWGHLPIALLRSAQLTILLGSRRGDSHKLRVSLGHACLELSAEEMISGKAASWQHGSPHAFLCQLNVRDDSHLKLFSKFNILPKTPGLSSTRHLAPPHALVRSPRGAGFRPEILLAAPSRLFEALTHFPLPSGGATSGKTYMEQMPFAPSPTATQCSLLQASWRSLSVFARLAFAVSVCQAARGFSSRPAWPAHRALQPSHSQAALPLWGQFLLAPVLSYCSPPVPPVPGAPYNPNCHAQPSPVLPAASPSSISHLTPAHICDQCFSPFPRHTSAAPLLPFPMALPLALLLSCCICGEGCLGLPSPQ